MSAIRGFSSIVLLCFAGDKILPVSRVGLEADILKIFHLMLQRYHMYISLKKHSFDFNIRKQVKEYQFKFIEWVFMVTIASRKLNIIHNHFHSAYSIEDCSL